MQNNRPESSPNPPEETSSLERGDEISSPTAAGDTQESGTAGAVDGGPTATEAVPAPDDSSSRAAGAPTVAPEAAEAALQETENDGSPTSDDSADDSADGRAGDAAADTGDSADPSATEGSSLERDDGEEVIYVHRDSIRRRPRYGRFIGVGVLVGAVLAVLIAQIGEVVGGGEGIGYSRTDLVLVLALTLVPLGALVGGAVAMFFDRRSRKSGPPQRRG